MRGTQPESRQHGIVQTIFSQFCTAGFGQYYTRTMIDHTHTHTHSSEAQSKSYFHTWCQFCRDDIQLSRHTWNFQVAAFHHIHHVHCTPRQLHPQHTRLHLHSDITLAHYHTTTVRTLSHSHYHTYTRTTSTSTTTGSHCSFTQLLKTSFPKHSHETVVCGRRCLT